MKQKQQDNFLRLGKLKFRLKPNNLETCEALLELFEEYEELKNSMLCNITRSADYENFILDKNEHDMIEDDLKNTEKLLKTAFKEDRAEIRKKIAKAKGDLAKVSEKIERPIYREMLQNYSTKLALVQARFKVSTDNFKILAQNMLLGEVNGIKFDDMSKETLRFKDQLFGVFFCFIAMFKIRTQIQMRSSDTSSMIQMHTQAQ